MDGGAAHLQAWRQTLERRLPEALADAPDGLREAMAYALTGGGKRLRPMLVLGGAVAASGGDPPALAWHAAVAIECVHAYSLVHDDLPAMDDDDMRRGRPSLHRAFGEATAILAGDALQAAAFAVLARCGWDAPAALSLVGELADAAGAAGMVGGQVLDLSLDAGADRDAVAAMHARKTGALFLAAARMGGLAAGADGPAAAALDRFGRAFGALYQAVDDLADADEDDPVRPSLVRALGAAAATAYAHELEGRARAALVALGERAGALYALVDEVATMLVPAGEG